MKKVVITLCLVLMFSLTVSSEVTYDSAEELSESPIGAMYNKVVILKDDDWMVKTGGEWENQKAWLNTVIENDAKATLGVVAGGHVPILKSIDSEFLQKHPDKVEIFCHGLTHVIVRNATHKYNEFRGTPASSQNYSLWKSREIIMDNIGYDLNVFGAPGNAWDDNTDKLVVSENGFLVAFVGGGKDAHYYRGVVRLTIDWSAGGPSDLQSAIEKYDEFRNDTLLVIQTHSWGLSADLSRVWGGFYDYLIRNESRVFMTGYEFYKWYFDKGMISLREDGENYLLDLSKTQFDHELTFDLRDISEVVVTDKTSGEKIKFKKTYNRIVFKTEAGHVYEINQKTQFSPKPLYILLAVILSSILLARYLKLFK